MSVGDKAASRRAEALLALQSKLKIIDDAKDVWTAKRAQINEDMGPVLKESIMGRERVARREENLEGTKERVGTRERTISDLEETREALKAQRAALKDLKSCRKHIASLNKSMDRAQKRLDDKSKKLSESERESKTTQGAILMFTTELQAIQGDEDSSPQEIRAVKKRIAEHTSQLKRHERAKAKLTKDVSALRKEALSIRDKLAEARVKMAGLEAVGGGAAATERSSLDRQIRRKSVDLSAAKSEHSGLAEMLRRDTKQLEKLREEVKIVGERLNVLVHAKEDADRRLHVIDRALSALNRRISLVKSIDVKDIVAGAPLGFPSSLEMNCDAVLDAGTSESEGTNRPITSRGKLTLTWLLLLYEPGEGGDAKDKTADNPCGRFCVDVSDIEACAFDEGKRGARQGHLTVTLREGHVDRFQGGGGRQEARFPRCTLDFNGVGVAQVESVAYLLQLAVLAHRATDSSLESGYTIFPKHDTETETGFVLVSPVKAKTKQEPEDGKKLTAQSLPASPNAKRGKQMLGDAKGPPPWSSLAYLRRNSMRKSMADILESISFRTPSKILNKPTLRNLISYMPRSLHNDDWGMYYSLENGASLDTFYSCVKGLLESVLIVRDSDGRVFGAFVSSKYVKDDYYHGNGRTWVFAIAGAEGGMKVADTAADDTKVRGVRKYAWSGKNELILLCKKDHLAIGGGGGGGFALRLDGRLCAGTSAECATFDSPMLAGKTDFRIFKLEVWAPVDVIM